MKDALTDLRVTIIRPSGNETLQETVIGLRQLARVIAGQIKRERQDAEASDTEALLDLVAESSED